MRTCASDVYLLLEHCVHDAFSILHRDAGLDTKKANVTMKNMDQIRVPGDPPSVTCAVGRVGIGVGRSTISTSV